MKSQLQYYGLSGHGNINPNTLSERTVSRRVLCVKRVLKNLNACVNDVIDLKERYVMNELRSNKQIINVIKPRIETFWIREQNLLMRHDRKSQDLGIQIAMTGVLSHWSHRQWNDFNRSVCTYIFNVLTFVCANIIYFFVYLIKIYF